MGVENVEGVELLATIGAVIIGVMWGVCFIAGTLGKAKPLNLSDRFDIGYYDPPDPPEPKIIYVRSPDGSLSEKPKKKKQPKKVAKPEATKDSCPEDDKLRQDCVDALVALGTKKSEARRVTAQVLTSNPQITDVQQFIPVAFQRN